MDKLLRCAFGKAFAWVTGKFIGEVAVSAVVTLAMAGMFTRPTSNREAQLSPPPAPVVAAAEPQWKDFPLDLTVTGSLASDAAASARIHLPALATNPQAVTADEIVPLPPRRPADIELAATVAPREPKPHHLPQVAPTAIQALAVPASVACEGSVDDAPCPPGLIPDDRLTANAGLAEPESEGREPPEVLDGRPRRLWLLPRVVLGAAAVRQTIAGLASRF
jgi:hypothetical protein